MNRSFLWNFICFVLISSLFYTNSYAVTTIQSIQEDNPKSPAQFEATASWSPIHQSLIIEITNLTSQENKLLNNFLLKVKYPLTFNEINSINNNDSWRISYESHSHDYFNISQEGIGIPPGKTSVVQIKNWAHFPNEIDLMNAQQVEDYLFKGSNPEKWIIASFSDEATGTVEKVAGFKFVTTPECYQANHSNLPGGIALLLSLLFCIYLSKKPCPTERQPWPAIFSH